MKPVFELNETPEKIYPYSSSPPLPSLTVEGGGGIARAMHYQKTPSGGEIQGPFQDNTV
jgi:hypothetical protein